MAKPDNKVYTQLVTQNEQAGIVLSPEILKLYKDVNDALPVLIVQAVDGQLKREYRYAMGGQIAAGLALVLMAGGFVFLVMYGHETPAYALLGAGVLNTIGGFLRARLNDGNRRSQEHRAKLEELKSPDSPQDPE